MKRNYTVVLFLFISFFVFSTTPDETLVRFSDLSFQSDFEKQVFVNYQHENELNLCLASDKEMTKEKAVTLKNSYEDLLKLLRNEKLTAKNFRQKFKNTNKIVFHYVPMHYYEGGDFSNILINGDFNYLTASALYSLVLKDLHIPSYLLFAQNKTTIIINPGAEQAIVETMNRKAEAGHINSSDRKSSIMNLLDKKVQPVPDYRPNPLQGNTYFKVNELEILKNTQLPAMIYYYKAILQYNAGKEEEAYGFIRKACYLCPEESYVNMMYTMITNKMHNCEFDRLEDVDLLGQLSRFDENNFTYIHKTFQSMLATRIDEKNDMVFCTSAYNRLLPQIKDVLLADEISYTYFLVSAYFNNTYLQNLTPAIEALKLKPLDKNALRMVEMGLNYKRERVEETKSFLDTLDRYEKDLDKTEAKEILKNLKLLTYLDLSKHSFSSNQLQEGLKYINLFESGYQLPLSKTQFKIEIENTYYEYAMYYIRTKNRAVAQKIVDKGLQYIPNSNMIQSATYELPWQKPKIIKRTMNKAEYDKYMKKNGPNR